MQKRLINVCDIGADPSGLHDSTEAFKQALASTTGQGVIVPFGTYSISGLIKDCTALVDDEAKGEAGKGPGSGPPQGSMAASQPQRVTIRKKGRDV